MENSGDQVTRAINNALAMSVVLFGLSVMTSAISGEMTNQSAQMKRGDHSVVIDKQAFIDSRVTY